MPVSDAQNDQFSVLNYRKKYILTFSIVSARFIPAKRQAPFLKIRNKNFINKLFKSHKSTINVQDLNNQAVIISFNFTGNGIESLYNLEDILEEIIKKNKVGILDGHEIGPNGDCKLFLYGPNAEILFKVIKSVFENNNSLKNVTARLRFGADIEESKSIDVNI